MQVPLIDLKAQYMSLQWEINEAVMNVLAGGQYIMGPNVKALENEIAAYCDTKYAVGVANGTDALVLSLEAYGVGSGDEVITTAYSFFATAEAISRVGAVPVFVDIDPDTYNIDPAAIENKINSRTRAVVPVHLFGQPALMDAIMKIANRHKLIVIEDACQAIGASYKGRRTGSWGHAGCFSFFPTKNLGAYGDGGMITSGDEQFISRVSMLRAHGSRRKYYNEVIGCNSRLDEIQAAALRVKLKHLDRWNEDRKKAAAYYDKNLAPWGLKTPTAVEGAQHVYHLYIIRHEQRARIVESLKERGISSGIYYPVPLHLQEAYKGRYSGGPLPAAEKAARENFAIPMFPEMSSEQLMYVTEQLTGILSGLNG